MQGKVLSYLKILRVLSFGILVFILYWSFSEINFSSLFSYSIPLVYRSQDLNYQFPKLFAIVLPILFNLALWNLNYTSYIFIRVVVITEICKVFASLVMSLLTTIALLIGLIEHGDIITMILVYGYFGALIYLLKLIHQSDWKKLFYDQHEVTRKKKITAVAIVGVIYYSLFFLFLIEKNYQESNFISLNDIRQYYVEGHSKKEEYIGYTDRLRMSSDGKWFSNVYFEDSYKGKVGIFDIISGDRIKNISAEDVYYSVFSANNKSLFFS